MVHMKTTRWVAGAVCGLCAAAGAAFAADWHVATNGSDAADGASWATAKQTIQAAVDAAAAGETVWVSNGVYATGGRTVPGAALTNRVVIDKPLAVQSANGPEVTIIQGMGPNGAAATRCVYVGTNAILSGFTLTNGATRWDGNIDREQSGGGAWGEASGILTNCVLIGNSAAKWGGGSYGGTLNSCDFRGNISSDGGGGSSQGLLSDCILIGNSASGDGGGTFRSTLIRCALENNSANYGGGSCFGTLESCTLTGNSASTYGGGSCWGTLNQCTLTSNSAHNAGGGASECDLSNCVLAGNSAQKGGGANGGTLTDCTASGNSAGVQGGGANASVLQDCELRGNVAQGNGGGAQGCELHQCVVVGNSANDDGGGACDSRLTRCTVTDNSANRFGGGVNGSTLEFCLVRGNSAPDYGGGAYNSFLNHCEVVDNTASVGGGANSGSSSNCLFEGNLADYGGGGFGVAMTHCTLIYNEANSDGGGTYSGVLNNCIVYRNVSQNAANHTHSTMQYCCTTPDPGGIGNVTNDPQFADAAAGNYRLQAISPGIDAGDKAFVSGTTDLDGNPRIMYGAVDMGAYEAQLAGAGTWFGAITNGLTNDLDCVAGDGVPNLLKYATSGSPRISDEQMRMTRDPNNGAPTLVFNRNTNATDVALVIQGAEAISNGAVWRGVATNIGGSWGGAANVDESGSGNPVVCTVEDLVPLRTNRFLRLKVTRP